MIICPERFKSPKSCFLAHCEGYTNGYIGATLDSSSLSTPKFVDDSKTSIRFAEWFTFKKCEYTTP